MTLPMMDTRPNVPVVPPATRPSLNPPPTVFSTELPWSSRMLVADPSANVSKKA